MSWLASIAIALLTAAVGLMLGGYLASLAVGWYRVSSFEGGAGYFVVGLALVGFVVGLALGLFVSRVVAVSVGFGFWNAFFASQLTIFSAVATDTNPTNNATTIQLAIYRTFTVTHGDDGGAHEQHGETKDEELSLHVRRHGEIGIAELESRIKFKMAVRSCIRRYRN